MWVGAIYWVVGPLGRWVVGSLGRRVVGFIESKEFSGSGGSPFVSSPQRRRGREEKKEVEMVRMSFAKASLSRAQTLCAG